LRDISLEGHDLKRVLIRGKVELKKGAEAQLINHTIHVKHIIPKAFTDPAVATYLSSGDDMTIKVKIEKLVSWNLTDSMVGGAIRKGRWSRPDDTK
jgi:hypothetical protein